ncbi:MAG: HNH endonuclease [Bacteroidales bacterium]|nr:HNH endonuclease [Bacteroidales bacterium]
MEKRVIRHTLHETFHDYLRERFGGDESEVTQTLDIAESIIPDMLNQSFGTNYGSIYEIQDVNDIEEFRKKIKAHPVLRSQDMASEPRFTEVLRDYRLFVKALNSNTIPIPVPGETDKTNPLPATPPSETASPKKRLSTIYLEGEAGEAQEVVYRQRNMELRQACIDHFKELHGGRLVCECCGFDFKRAYAIEDEYIEVHHRFPFSQTDGEHPVDATTDLVPLCANCHRMIHHGMGGRGNCMSLDELKSKLR